MSWTPIWFVECNSWLFKVKKSCCVCRDILTFNAYYLNSSYLFQIYICIPEIFKTNISKPVFDYKITFWICFIVLSNHKGYFVVKKLVWKVRIKAFCYTNIYYIMFIIRCFTRAVTFSCINPTTEERNLGFVRYIITNFYFRYDTNNINTYKG